VILRSTINLGHALNLKVVAEGVEIAASWEALGHFGCDLVQGYFVSKPLPAADFMAWANSRQIDAPRAAAPGAPDTQPVPALDRRISAG
jgi:EAL domain-containing protein (putative c-di-GMP-specific phosphodiesterase class I)